MKIVLVGGGSWSGKTTLVNRLKSFWWDQKILALPLDDYYQTDMFKDPNLPRDEFNFDDPKLIWWDLVRQNLEELKAGKTTKKPIYDFVSSHTIGYEEVAPKPIVILEGIFALYPKWLRDMADLKIFVDEDIDTMLARRLIRDVKERWRELDGVLNRYFKFVKPAFFRYVLPYKLNADLVIRTKDLQAVVGKLMALMM